MKEDQLVEHSARTRGMRSVGSMETAERSLPEEERAHLRYRLIWGGGVNRFIK
jgi:hypothetical protein